MNTETTEKTKQDAVITIDLNSVLSPEELDSFREQADKSGASTLSEHASKIFFGAQSEKKEDVA